jgi:hypothetical protein
MRRRTEQLVEAALDWIAAAVLAGAVAFSAFELLSHSLTAPQRLICALAAGLLAFTTSARLLRRAGAKRPSFELRTFAFPDLSFEEVEELVLTDADRLHPVAHEVAHERPDELVLDDILDELGPDARVVRLFDPAAMPTPGQLNARIEQHLHPANPAAALGDASEALYEALSELRRSLR